MAQNDTTTSVGFEITHTNLVIIIISVLGVKSNGLLLIAFLKDPLKCYRNSGTYLVINLSISDCLTCLVVPFFHTSIFEVPFGSNSILEFCIEWFGITSFFSITSISFDRLLMVAYPIKYRVLVSNKTILLWLALIWKLSLISPVFGLIYSNTQHGRTSWYICTMVAILLAEVMYAFTYSKLKNQSRNIALHNTNQSRAQEIRILKEKRFLKTIIIVACIAFICIVPAMIYLHVVYYQPGLLASAPTIAPTITFGIFYTNFAVNPLIYIIRLPNYRKTFYLLYCRGKI